MSKKEEICAFCKCHAKHQCSACKIVYYCSREHQKSDWKEHSKNCGIVKLVHDDPKFGRHYIATRDIEIDEIVLKENKPLLVVPEPEIGPVCLNCYVPLTPDIRKPCKNCGWPLCLECTKHEPECQLIMEYRRSKIETNGYSIPNDIYSSIPNNIYCCIIIMRAIALRKMSPKDFEKLMTLEDHCDKPLKNRLDPIQEARRLKNWIGIYDLNEADIARILRIVGVNAFSTVTPKQYEYATVFDKASYCTHDCRPNCMWKTYHDENTKAKMIIRAVRMIPKGQPITIAYTDTLVGTEKRRRILEISKFFECTCDRCKDPTELGTMLSAVKCIRKDCTGYMLPPTFLVSPGTQIPDWICKKCDLTTPSTTIDEIMNEASSQFDKLDSKNSNELKEFIVDQSKILHHNHFHIINAEIETMKGKLADPRSMSNELLKEKITFFKKLSSLLEIIAPNGYDIRGRLRYAEYKYMMWLNRREFSRDSVESFGLYKNMKKLLTEAFRLLLNDEDDNTSAKDEFIRLQLKETNELSKILKMISRAS